MENKEKREEKWRGKKEGERKEERERERGKEVEGWKEEGRGNKISKEVAALSRSSLLYLSRG